MYLYQILVDAVETLKMPEFHHSPQTQTDVLRERFPVGFSLFSGFSFVCCDAFSLM